MLTRPERRRRQSLHPLRRKRSVAAEPTGDTGLARSPKWPWLGIRPTGAGARFLLLLLVMGFAAFNTRNNLLYLMFSIGISSAVVSAAFGWLSLRRIKLDTGEPPDLYAGSASTEHLRIRNGSRWLDGFGLEVEELDFPGRSPCAEVAHIGRRKTKALALEKNYPRRGIFESERMLVSTRFPFGLFRAIRQIRLSRRLIVFPRLHRVNISFVFRSRTGQVPQRQQRGDSEELLRVRDYSVGDNLHYVHWKATAKLGRLMVREFASDQQRRFTIILDNQTAAASRRAGDGEEFEKTVSAAASLSCHLGSHGLPFRLVSADAVFPYDTSPEHLRGVLIHLAEVSRNREPQHDLAEWTASSLRGNDVVLVVSAHLERFPMRLASPALHLIQPAALVAEGDAPLPFTHAGP